MTEPKSAHYDRLRAVSAMTEPKSAHYDRLRALPAMTEPKSAHYDRLRALPAMTEPKSAHYDRFHAASAMTEPKSAHYDRLRALPAMTESKPAHNDRLRALPAMTKPDGASFPLKIALFSAFRIYFYISPRPCCNKPKSHPCLHCSFPPARTRTFRAGTAERAPHGFITPRTPSARAFCSLRSRSINTGYAQGKASE